MLRPSGLLVEQILVLQKQAHESSNMHLPNYLTKKEREQDYEFEKMEMIWWLGEQE